MNKSRFLALILAGALITTACACGRTDIGDEIGTGTDTSADISAGAFDYSAALDENGFFKGVKASDIVKLPEYKGVEMPTSILVAAEEDVQAQIDMILESYSTDIYAEIKDAAIKDGDTVNIDYVGSVDGVEFEGGSTGGKGTIVTIGVTNYIDDFLEQLIGHKPGENFDIEVTFPEDYGVDNLNGKDAIFNITVNYIQGALLETIIPELSDDIAANYGFENVEALKADIENWLINSQKKNFINNLLTSATCEEIPQSVLDHFINENKALIENYAAMYGVSVDEYMKMGGYDSFDAYIADQTETFKTTALTYLAAQAIAELEGITVTEDDITANGYDTYIESYGAPYVKQYLLVDVVVSDFILSNAKEAK